ncbi:hypothetical protein V490_00030 [Pseudogymnoascus sp. VKM F-3557]|nr:hypothetical protein V490_00030 [Pseudogymnoascus sp. VKM F-3557]
MHWRTLILTLAVLTVVNYVFLNDTLRRAYSTRQGQHSLTDPKTRIEVEDWEAVADPLMLLGKAGIQELEGTQLDKAGTQELGGTQLDEAGIQEVELTETQLGKAGIQAGNSAIAPYDADDKEEVSPSASPSETITPT